jgi:hypothetical protein
MFSYIDNKGATHQVSLSEEEINAMASGGAPVADINKKFQDADLSIGTAFDQFKASVGLLTPNQSNPFGLKASLIGDVFDGKAGFQANVQRNASPFGTASRAFVNIAVIDAVMSAVQPDRSTDIVTFRGMASNTMSLTTEHFEQPVVSMDTTGGPEQAKAQRVAQGAEPAKMLFFKTADRIRRLGAWTIGMQWTEQALRNTTIDYVTQTMGHYLSVELDERAYRYTSDLYVGNADMVVGAVSSVGSSTLDAASTGGVLTHKAWVKFLARQRKKRNVTHIITDIDTYLKIEDRTGRPGSNNYDPTLARIDPQAVMSNNTFGGDVRLWLVDAATDGGPVPANTVYALDSSKAFTLVTNTAAAYQGVQEFAMRRMTAMRMDWSEEVFRTFGDTDLTPFDILTITP